MSEPLRELILWRHKAVLIACHLKGEKRIKAARLLLQAAEEFEEYLQDEFGDAYLVELGSLIREREARNQVCVPQVIPFRSEGGRP